MLGGHDKVCPYTSLVVGDPPHPPPPPPLKILYEPLAVIHIQLLMVITYHFSSLNFLSSGYGMC